MWKIEKVDGAHWVAMNGKEVRARLTYGRGIWLITFPSSPGFDWQVPEPEIQQEGLDRAIGYVRGVERALGQSAEALGVIAGVVRRVVKALQAPRNRYGKLEADAAQHALLHPLIMAAKPPHGGADIIDQACMILQAAIGDKVTPIDEVLQDVDMAGRRRVG